MNHYPLALYLHIVGALGFFVALGLEWTSVHQLRRALSASQIRDCFGSPSRRVWQLRWASSF